MVIYIVFFDKDCLKNIYKPVKYFTVFANCFTKPCKKCVNNSTECYNTITVLHTDHTHFTHV